MEVPEIKKEVENNPGDLKVKLEENSSSVVYKVEVSPIVDIKPKQEHPPQSNSTLVTNQEIQSVNLGQDTANCKIEFEPESNNTSNEQSKSAHQEDFNDFNQKNPQEFSPSSQARLIKNNENIPNPIRRKRCGEVQKRQLLQCTLCSRYFSSVEILIAHAQKEHGKVKNPKSDPISDDEDETTLQCPLCSKSLASVWSLQRHFLRFHNKNNPYQCAMCLESTNEIKKFATQSLLKTHVKTVHGPARYKFQCDICCLKFPSSSHYKRHKRTHIEKQYKCEYCSNAYREKESMLRHIIAVHKEYTDRHETFKCDECEQLFCSKKDLDGHALQTHDRDPLQCEICFKKFMEEGKLNMHLKVSHRENRTWLVCDVCSKVFNNNKDLVKHLEVKHKRFFKCRKCFRSFVSKKEYASHSTEILDKEGRHPENFKLQCKICFVFFSTECSFTAHKNTHLNTNELERKIISQLDPNDPQDCLLKCDFCPKTFVQKSLLLKHARACHPNRKLKCKSCEKSFQVKFQLNKHKLLHFRNKLLECQVCHKGFANLKLLKQHEGIHKVDKKFKCSQCEKSFAFRCSLNVHIANHHGGKKNFKCDICKKAFVSKSHLENHSTVHTDERPFSYSKCSNSYKYPTDLRRHQQNIHPENTLNKYRKRKCHPVRLGPHLKRVENFVFVCCLEKCDFKTKDEKEVAIHNAKHKLPKVLLPRLLDGPSGQVFLSKSTPDNKHLVQVRYECSQCFKILCSSQSLSEHMKIFHSEKKSKRKKKRYAESSSGDDQV